MLEGGDLEHGRPTDKVPDMILVEGPEKTMSEVVDVVCERLVETVQG